MFAVELIANTILSKTEIVQLPVIERFSKMTFSNRCVDNLFVYLPTKLADN